MFLTPVESYIWEQPENVRDIMDLLKSVIMEAYPEVNCTLKWKVPYFIGKKSICYLNSVSKKSVEMAFIRAKLFDPEVQRLLDFKNRTMVAGITFDTVETINEDHLEKIITEAIRIDKEEKDLIIGGGKKISF